MEWGISSYSLTWAIGVPGYEPPVKPLSAFDLLRIAKVNEIKLVQIADNLPLHLLSEEELTQLHDQAAEWGIAFEIGMRGVEPERLLAYLHIAKRLEARVLRTLIEEANLAFAAEQIRQVLPQFEEAGVLLAIENHGLHTTTQLSALIRDINHAGVGICLDTVNSFGALENPEQVIAHLAPYIHNVHIKDFDVTRLDHQMGFMITGTPAGKGRLDIPNLWRTICQQERRATAILELWVPYEGSTEQTIDQEARWLEESIDYLKSLQQL